MTGPRGVTAEELVRALKRRRATLPAEIGTFIALETCEVLVSRGPCAVSPATVQISDEGAVSVVGAEVTDEEGGARALHATLTSLLVAAGPAPTPALMRLVEEGPHGGAWTLMQMLDDLEASLVPLNRTASTRVLARLVRETSWEQRPSARPAATPSFRDLDSELSSLLGVPDEPAHDADEPSHAAEEPRRPVSKRDRDATVRDAVDYVDAASGEVHFFDADVPAAAGGLPNHAKTVVEQASYEASPSMALPLRGRERAPGSLRDLDALDGRPPRSEGSRSLWLGVVLVVLAAALAAVTLMLRPDVRARLSGSGEPAADQVAPASVQRAEGGDLLLRVTTERAQVLRFIGRGPITVEHLPTGVAHEFVAIGDGVQPTRVVIPPNADWERTPEGARYEAAMQLGKALPEGAPLDLGDTLLPQNVGTPSSSLGSVRIVTTPRGAKVYQLIGFAPEVKVEDLPLDQTQELLIFRKGYAPVVRVVAPSDFVEQGDRKLADVSIELAPLTKQR